MEIHTTGRVCVSVFIRLFPLCLDGCIQHLNVTYGFQALRLNIFEFYYNLSFTRWKAGRMEIAT